MSLTAGTISLVSKSSNSANLAITAASGGTGPYTNQWYRSTTTGFTPGGGNILTGQTALSLSDSGLIPGTIYYYKVIQTDTGHSNDVVTATQLAVTTDSASQSINSFAQAPFLGQLDLKVGPTNVVAVQIDASQATALYAGSFVKIVDSADGVPKVVGVAANSDEALGCIVYDIKSKQYVAGDRAELAMSGSVIFLYATTAIARGVQVVPDVISQGSVQAAAGQTGSKIVGWAYDKASAYGDLIRVVLKTPSFTVV